MSSLRGQGRSCWPVPTQVGLDLIFTTILIMWQMGKLRHREGGNLPKAMGFSLTLKAEPGRLIPPSVTQTSAGGSGGQAGFPGIQHCQDDPPSVVVTCLSSRWGPGRLVTGPIAEQLTASPTDPAPRRGHPRPGPRRTHGSAFRQDLPPACRAPPACHRAAVPRPCAVRVPSQGSHLLILSARVLTILSKGDI